MISDEKAGAEAILLSTEQRLSRIRCDRALSLRLLFKTPGIAGATFAAGSVLNGCMGSGAVMAQSVSETDVLNFALNLEYLEATFYSYVVTGADIPSSSTGGGPAPTGAPSATPNFQTGEIADLFAEIYFDELSHVNDLRSVLGSAAVARPQLALAALGIVGTANYITHLCVSGVRVLCTAHRQWTPNQESVNGGSNGVH